MWNPDIPETPVLQTFLTGIRGIIQSRDGAKLQDFLQLEPPLPDIYHQMIQELRQAYPSGSSKDEQLLSKCESLVPTSESGSTWSAFPLFMHLYFSFLRDVNLENLLETYELLRTLLNQCIVALGDSQSGVIVLPTVLYLCKVLAKFAIGLDRRPELIAHLLREGSGSDGTTEKVTVVEKSANVVREAFIKCLTDRTGTLGKPEGKRIGIYVMANLCLKLLFKCGKLRNAEQMFASINTQSPPLSYFPASERVTYLYYLGRYLFSNNLFYPAQTALQSAYDQSHKQALSQRRLILTYLIPCNIILGRFPSIVLMQRPECQTLGEKFIPLCQIIRRGDLPSFRAYLDVESEPSTWFAQKGILLQLRNRCEILVWRSLARKVFIFSGFHGNPSSQAQRGPPPFLYLQKLEAAVKFLESRQTPSNSTQDVNQIGGFVSLPTDIDFRDDATGDLDSNDFLNPTGYFNSTGEWLGVNNPAELPERHLAESNAVYGDCKEAFTFVMNTKQGYRDTELTESPSPLMRDLESVLASLLNQDLMKGYLTHKNPRYAIPGARVRGALPTGFPNVWETIYARESEVNQVPGWVKPANTPNGPAAMGGRVVNLGGARPVGATAG